MQNQEPKIKKIIEKGKTAFQEYLFFESEMHGVCISLDGDLQSCASDEAIYHEALVRPAMQAHKNPKSVLIMGGGEGATAREVLRHNSVERVVMVDIDREFVALCKKHIPSWGAAAFSDARLELLHMDINEYLKEPQEKFDIVIGDLIDVADWDSPVAALYGEDLYRRLKGVLKSGAVIATQAGAFDGDSSTNLTQIRERLEKVFANVKSYGVFVPSFYQEWGYLIASDEVTLKEEIKLDKGI